MRSDIGQQVLQRSFLDLRKQTPRSGGEATLRATNARGQALRRPAPVPARQSAGRRRRPSADSAASVPVRIGGGGDCQQIGWVCDFEGAPGLSPLS